MTRMSEPTTPWPSAESGIARLDAPAMYGDRSKPLGVWRLWALASAAVVAVLAVLAWSMVGGAIAIADLVALQAEWDELPSPDDLATEPLPESSGGSFGPADPTTAKAAALRPPIGQHPQAAGSGPSAARLLDQVESLVAATALTLQQFQPDRALARQAANADDLAPAARVSLKLQGSLEELGGLLAALTASPADPLAELVSLQLAAGREPGLVEGHATLALHERETLATSLLRESANGGHEAGSDLVHDAARAVPVRPAPGVWSSLPGRLFGPAPVAAGRDLAAPSHHVAAAATSAKPASPAIERDRLAGVRYTGFLQSSVLYRGASGAIGLFDVPGQGPVHAFPGEWVAETGFRVLRLDPAGAELVAADGNRRMLGFGLASAIPSPPVSGGKP